MKHLGITLIFSCMLWLTIGRSHADDGRVLLQDNFAGIMTNLPGGVRALYPNRQLWDFSFWPGSVWPKSYGRGTNWLNDESQTYLTPFIGEIKQKIIPEKLRYNPFSIKPDGLHITADLLTSEQQTAYQVGLHRRFGSGMLRSKVSFTYGKIRMVAKLPSARGSWPAFWLLPKARIWPPEIDIFEGMAWGSHSEQIHFGVLPPKGESGFHIEWIDLGFNPSAGFHEYGLDWTAETLKLLVDGKTLRTIPTPASMHQPMYVLINLAVGGKWPYNELGLKPIDSSAPERLMRGADLIQGDYPSTLVIKSISVREK